MDIYNLMPTEDGWSLFKSNAKKSIKTFLVKADAMLYAGEFLRGKDAEIRIYKEDGTEGVRIQECTFLDSVRISSNTSGHY